MQAKILGVLVVVSLCAATMQAAMTRVRPLSDRGQRLVAVGREVSPTIRAMLDRIEQSDLILHLDLRVNPDVSYAVTQLATSTDDVRYVRVSINPRQSPLRRLELLAHELQHVLEIADAPEVRTDRDMREYFTRIGRRTRGQSEFETDAALRVESVVRNEVAKSGRWRPGLLDPPPFPQ